MECFITFWSRFATALRTEQKLDLFITSERFKVLQRFWLICRLRSEVRIIPGYQMTANLI